MRKRIVIFFGAAALALGTAGVAGAAQGDPFLCPIVGDGVLNQPSENVIDPSPPAGTSLSPGNNQAGPNADDNAYNSVGDGAPNSGNTPGTAGFTPIWTGTPG